MVRYPDREPYDPPDDFPPNDRPGFNTWEEVTPSVFRDDDSPEGRTPRLLAAKFESSSREAEIFLHDPISTLVDGAVDGIHSAIRDRSELPDNPTITTLVMNHHRRLDYRVIRATAMVDDEAVGITVHKEDGS